MLSSSTTANVRRTVGAAQTPVSALKSETSAPSKVAGANSPSEKTLESSAANIDSASTNHRDEFSAEKGNSSVDFGPTKIVIDQESERRSGGGQPELAQLEPDSPRRSNERSDESPSLAAAIGIDVSAPGNPSSVESPPDAPESSATSNLATRSGGESAITSQRWSAQTTGDVTDEGQSNLAQQLSDSRSKANRSEDESGWDEHDDDENEEKNQSGTQRNRIARAPIIRSNPGSGIARNDGPATTQNDARGDAPAESETSITRTSNASISGAGIGRAAANILMQATTSMPVGDVFSERRRSQTKTNNSAGDTASSLAERPTPRSTRSAQPNVKPLSTDSETNAAVAGDASAPNAISTTDLESKSTSVSRSSVAAKQSPQGRELDIIADEGPAGLGERPSELIGVMTRPASRDSQQIQPDLNRRFRNPLFGGTPSLNPDAVIAKEAFSNRGPAATSRAAEPTTEAAIDLGLEFLARHQLPDGNWSLAGFDLDAPEQLTLLDSDTAATGLALLAFQGAGYNHREFKYAHQVDLGIKWLIENQSENGGLYVPSNQKSDNACRLYSHGIAALALTESYGMTQDERLKDPAQKAIDYIVKSQDSRKGGWRYFDTPGKKSADTSVSGWMMMALQSGRLAGLEFKNDTLGSVEDWLDVASDPDNESLYRYNPYAVDSKGVSRNLGRQATASMTSVGLLMRIYSGWHRNDPRVLAGADFLLNNQLPDDSTSLKRDSYYWYYATQVLKHVGGTRWETWNAKLRPLLIRSQVKTGELAGSWHPYKPIPDRWGAFGGRIYVTTMNLLSLEVRHRMLPLYRQNDSQEIIGTFELAPEQE